MNKWILSIFITSILTICCNTTESTNDKIDGGERNYIWSIDTISSGSGQTYMTSIWGSSKSNVWICGHDANNTTNIYHYDGQKWEAKSNIPPTNFAKSYSVITGIDSNYFVLAGSADFYNSNPPPTFLDSGLVIKFENGTWSVDYLNNSSGISSMAIISKNDFWVGDRQSNLLHYYNNEWHKYSFTQKMLFNGLTALNKNNVYATAHSENGTASVDYLLFFQGVSWTIIDSNITSGEIIRNSFPTLIKNIGGQLYGSGDIGVVKKEGDAWVVIGENLYGQIHGTSAINIFLGNQDFGVMHYNGKNWYKFNELPPLYYFEIAVFDDSVFLLATDGIKSYIVKGFKQ